LGQIYTFGPTFRAENSNTSRHLAEFGWLSQKFIFNDWQHGLKIYSVRDQIYLDKCPEDLKFRRKIIRRKIKTTSREEAKWLCLTN
jgi:asparaginyl-tRNA synthetase